MIFEEKDTIEIPINYKNFIYFLIDNNKVVYVGKTSNNIIRPFSHKDKCYDRLEIKLCNEDELDILEDKYIKKYNPCYNRQLNYAVNYSYQKIKRELYKVFNKKISLWKIKRIIKELKIETITYSNGIFINKKDYGKIVEYIKNE